MQKSLPSKPAVPAAPKVEPDTQDIQAEFVSKDKMTVTLKDCVGEEQTYRADLDVVKVLAKEDGPVKPGTKYKVRMVRQGEEWVVSRIGPFDETFGEKPFRTGKEILQQNLDEKRAETAKAEAALAQIKKENDEAAQRFKEHEEYAKSLVGATGAAKTMPTTETPTEPEKCPQNESSTETDIAGAVGLKIHINLGSFCNFDLSVEGQSGEHARQLLKQEAEKSIPLVANIMREAMKVSQQVRY